MRNSIKLNLFAVIVLSSFQVGWADLINNSTPGYYNDSIGKLLNETNPYGSTFLFPGDDCSPGGDPTIFPAPEPDLSTASGVLGDWLANPASLNSNWSGPQAIPSAWAINTETAIVYELNNTNTMMLDITATLGVDNGIFVWLDGAYKFGALNAGIAYPDEYTASLGVIDPGLHYLQILREDHGAGTGYYISVTGEPVPVPSAFLLGFIGLGMARQLLKKHKTI